MDGGTGAGVFIPQAHFSMTAALQVAQEHSWPFWTGMECSPTKQQAQDAKKCGNFQQNLT